jgi:hypothetical protein
MNSGLIRVYIPFGRTGSDPLNGIDRHGEALNREAAVAAVFKM